MSTINSDWNNQDPHEAYLHINFYILRMQMKRNENMPYMYDHNHQKNTYNIKEGMVWGKERKKERGKHLCLLGIGWWTILLPWRDASRWVLCLLCIVKTCEYFHISIYISLIGLCYSQLLQWYTVVTAILSPAILNLFSCYFRKWYFLWIWTVKVFTELRSTVLNW